MDPYGRGTIGSQGQSIHPWVTLHNDEGVPSVLECGTETPEPKLLSDINTSAHQPNYADIVRILHSNLSLLFHYLNGLFQNGDNLSICNSSMSWNHRNILCHRLFSPVLNSRKNISSASAMGISRWNTYPMQLCRSNIHHTNENSKPVHPINRNKPTLQMS